MFFPPLENNISSKAPFNNIRRSSILQKKLSLNQSQRRLSLIYGLVPPKKLTQCKANRYGLSPCKNLTDNENGYCEIKPHQDLAKLENLNECTEEEEDPECEGHWNFSKYGVTADAPSKPWDDSKKLYSEFVELSNFIKSDYIKEFNLITEGSVNENLSGSLTYISGWPKKCLGFYMILPKKGTKWILISYEKSEDFKLTIENFFLIFNKEKLKSYQKKKFKETHKTLCLKRLKEAQFSIKFFCYFFKIDSEIKTFEDTLANKINFPLNETTDVYRNIKMNKDTKQLFNIFE
ncbi:hypothetical protein HDU92_009020 [Lobulomyces angularis]|nr:hypothetical protein HDU92_009020 [Lobulomyces angularis]